MRRKRLLNVSDLVVGVLIEQGFKRCVSVLFLQYIDSKGEESCFAIKTKKGDERIDWFWEYYKPYEMTSLDEMYNMSMANSER